MKPFFERESVKRFLYPDQHGPQKPAAFKPPVVHFVDTQTVATAHLVGLGVAFIAGLILGWAL